MSRTIDSGVTLAISVAFPLRCAVLTGRTLGDFTVGAKLGEGGYGIVYRAEQRALGREAVIKVLHARHGTNEAVVQRFLREAQLASRLDHPFAAHIYAFGAEPDGLLWIAMELVRGTTLRDVVAAQPGKKLPLARLVPLLDGLCEVVHTAHEQGIVHRDLKPDNIMVLSRAGRLLPKLLDLGIAKLVTSEAPVAAPKVAPETSEPAPAPKVAPEAALGATLVAPMATQHATLAPMATQHGGIVGSPHYMAPEQWAEGGTIDARTDVYALGVVAFELLAGRVPYSGSMLDLVEGHVHGKVPPVPDQPAAIDAVVRRALAKAPADRFPTALAFAEALRAAAGMRLTADALPRLDDTLRAEIAWMPQPIADAVAALEAARNPHQARDALWEIVRIVARWLGVVALAAHSRSGSDLTPSAVALLRELPRRELADDEWLELVRALVTPFARIRDAHPVPELVDLVVAEPSPFAALLALRAAEGAITSEESLRDRLARTLPVLAPLLRAITFLTAYQLVVPRGERGDVWMGTRRTARPVVAMPAGLAAGAPVLADLDGQPLLQLAPLVQVAAPAPGAPEELFVLAGPARVRGHGARLVAEPHGFEHHDDAVWTWLRTLLPTEEGATESPHTEVAPYRGLAAFTESDAENFFGRERAAQAFANQLLVQPLLAVVGPSGTGKSSFVRAGVVPILPAGWRATVVRPGAAPMTAIGEREPRLHGETRVLVVDQFEELFTLCHDASERERFVAALLALTADPHTRVVLTVRDDFLARAGELMREPLARAITLLATPANEDLARVLVEPAKRAGYDFEAGLVQAMVATVAGQPGALALLSFTALRLWELRDRHFKRLTRKAYDAIGGVEGALAQHAETTLTACTADEQRQVREVFRQLVTAEGTRAVMARSELAAVLGTGARAIDRLIEARLLIAAEGADGAEQIEIVHEALLAAWPRLVTWRREDVEGARLRDQLRAAAKQWHERERPRGLLWRDDALDEYTRWRARWPASLPELDQAFADASVRDARRGRRIRRGLAGTAATVLVAGVIALSLLYGTAKRNATEARDRELAAKVEQGRALLASGDYRAALAPLVTAYQLGERSRALRLMLHRTALLADVPILPLADTGVTAAFRDTGELVWVDYAGNAGIWDVATRTVRARLPAPVEARPENFGPAVSNDGRLVAVPSATKVTLWTGSAARQIEVAHAERAAFDWTGGRLAIATSDTLSVFELPSARVVWAAKLPAQAGKLAWAGDDVIVQDYAYKHAWRVGPAGPVELGACARIATSSNGLVACIGPDGVHVGERKIAATGVERVALSNDGKLVALARGSGVVELYTVATGAQLGVIPARGLQLAFTAHDDRLVVSDASAVAAWDIASLHEVMRYSSIGASATILAGAPYVIIDPPSRRVALVGVADIRVVTLDDPATRLEIDAGEPIGGSQWLGSDIFTTSETGVELWDGATGAARAHVVAKVKDNAHPSPDRTLVAIPLDGAPRVEVRELATGALRTTLTMDDDVRSAAFDPTGTRIVVADQRGDVDVFDLTGKRMVALRGHTTTATRAVFSNDGTRIVTAAFDATARVWDASSGRELGRVHHEDDVYDAELDASGTRLVTACHDRSVVIWDARTFKRIATFKLAAPANTAAFDSSGELVAAAGDDGVVVVFDLASRREILHFHHTDVVLTVAFGPRGLLSTSLDHRAVVWDLDEVDGTSVAHLASTVTATDSP